MAMDILRRFLDVNRDVVVFAYGLVFFVMGLAVALQSRRYSQLDLARSLSWLAAFGITHGFHEWGDFFIPIQAAYLSVPVVEFLGALHLVLLAVSFTCLFEFGATLLRSFGRARWLHGIAVGLLLAWLLAAFFVVLPLAPDLTVWRRAMNALARYGIGFPGALLAAYGLRQHALRRIAALNVPHIVRSLQVAGITIALYAVFSGLIPPPVPFFPGSVLNVATFEQAIGLPPLLFRSALGLVLAVTIIRTLEVFDVETDRMIEAMEQQQILAAERERIARQLHDGAIQTVYTAGLLVESAKRQAEQGEPGSPLVARLEKAMTVLNSAIGDLRHSLGELRASPAASGDALPVALRRLAEDPRFSSFVDIDFDVDLPDCADLPVSRADHILAITSEALSNVVRHAHARRVKVMARCADDRLSLVIRDDGQGMSGEPGAGYGLRNMRDRARLLGGRLEVQGTPGKGTIVALDMPWSDQR